MRKAGSHVYNYIGKFNAFLWVIEDICLAYKLFLWLQKPFYLSVATFPAPTGAVNLVTSKSESLSLGVGKWQKGTD